MAALQGLSKHYFNTYFHNNSILFQFILKEFISVATERQVLEKLVEEINAKITQNAKLSDQQLEILGEQLAKLSGTSYDHLWQLPWHLNGGILVKLKNYSYLYVRNSQKDDKAFTDIHDQTYKAWVNCKQTLDLVKDYLFYHWRTQEALDIINICAHLQKICDNIDQLSKLMERALLKFRGDENVLFFLLRHRAQMEVVYGPQFIQKLLLKMHPKGIGDLEVFLCKRYSQRGFEHLLPVISEKMAAFNT